MTEPLSEEAIKSYVCGGGVRCPYCRSSDIQSARLEADGPAAWADAECADCGRIWRDVYRLVTVEEVDEDEDTDE